MRRRTVWVVVAALLLAAAAGVAATRHAGPPERIWFRDSGPATSPTLLGTDGVPPPMAAVDLEWRGRETSARPTAIVCMPLDRRWSELLRDLGLTRDTAWTYALSADAEELRTPDGTYVLYDLVPPTSR